MDGKIPKKNKPKSWELVNPIIPLERPEKDDFNPSNYIDHMCHDTPVDSTLEIYVIKILRFDSGTLEGWIFFVDLVQKTVVAQNISTGTPMYKYTERVLKGDAKAEFTQQANLVGSYTSRTNNIN